MEMIPEAENKVNRKYAEIWHVEVGGVYQRDTFVVNIKAKHQIASCNQKIQHMVTNLFKAIV